MDSRLDLSECFEEIPATPGSQSILCVEEFEEASPMVSSYCRKLNDEEYENQGLTETEKALQELISHLESNPNKYTQVLRKKKKDEHEASGVVSFLKSRIMMKMQGERYEQRLVTETEANDKLQEMTSGMMMVYNYSKETHEGRRFSRRLAERRAKDTSHLEISPKKRGSKAAKKSGLCTRAPPPPPMPPPPIWPLQDCKNTMNSAPVTNKTVRIMKMHSSKRDSTGSIQEEVTSFDRVKRLKSTGRDRSPGFTPVKTPGRNFLSAYKDSPGWELNSSEPLTAAFLRVMDQKFRNVRSPSPSAQSLNSTTPFSPAEFSP